jgi:hypothetical protein
MWETEVVQGWEEPCLMGSDETKNAEDQSTGLSDEGGR